MKGIWTNLHSILVRLKREPVPRSFCENVNLHSILVRLKLCYTIYSTVFVFDLHSILVRLKLNQQIYRCNHCKHLHSILVRLKHQVIHWSNQLGLLFTFHSGKIKTLYYACGVLYLPYLHSILVRLKQVDMEIEQ